jgi:hypothetical protein
MAVLRTMLQSPKEKRLFPELVGIEYIPCAFVTKQIQRHVNICGVTVRREDAVEIVASADSKQQEPSFVCSRFAKDVER